MAFARGHLGAILVPTSVGNFAAQAFTEVGTSDIFMITNETTRIARAFTEASVLTDFVVTEAGAATFNPTSLLRGVGEIGFDETGYAAPYTVTSSNSRVYTLAQAAGFFNWTITHENRQVETTQFQDSWAEFAQVGVRGWTAEAESYYIDENLTVDAGAGFVDLDDAPFAVKFFIEYDATTGLYRRFEGLAHISGFDIRDTVGDVLRKRITFQGEEDLYYRSS